MSSRRHATTDAQWSRVADLFPPDGRRGGPWKDPRLMLDAMLWVPLTGAPWRDLPERLGPWKTAFGRFRRWTAEGLWDRALARLPIEAPTLDPTRVCVDGGSIRARRHAAGAREKGGARASPTTMPSGEAGAGGARRPTSCATQEEGRSRRP